jgi:hypothetical protein
MNVEFENVEGMIHFSQKNEIYIKAWQEGRTGVPIVDACMRCLVATGYINFRMRAMVVSFFTFNLWQDWRSYIFSKTIFRLRTWNSLSTSSNAIRNTGINTRINKL